MEGGIAILLLLILAVVIGAVFVNLAGGMQALRHRRGGDLGPREGDAQRPEHRVAEPDDEHAVGFGVGGEYGRRPRPARVRRDDRA
jgi:hypothetical protein